MAPVAFIGCYVWDAGCLAAFLWWRLDCGGGGGQCLRVMDSVIAMGCLRHGSTWAAIGREPCEPPRELLFFLHVNQVNCRFRKEKIE